MKRHAFLFLSLFAAALMLGLAGCNTERDKEDSDRAILKAGQQVSADMVNWVAVPNAQPITKLDKESKIHYAILPANVVIPASLNGWSAMPPELFERMSKIKVERLKMPALDRFVLKPEGKKVPQEMDSWVAVQGTWVQAESTGKKLQMAPLYRNQLVPKEMHNWVAVDKETLANLVENYMMTGAGSDLPKAKTPYKEKEEGTFEKSKE
jgi:hypothetical protein